jgi:catechol 2,3-dioxygenase-like lactoylglutathione lyase family enzyme
MTKPNPPSGILETSLYVGDLGEARAFYGGVLGLEEMTAVEGRHVFYRCGQAMLLLFVAAETVKSPGNPKMPVPIHGATGPGHACFRASADELDRWAEVFSKEAIEIEADFCWPNGARSIYVRDPAGNSIEFAEPRLWGF